MEENEAIEFKPGDVVQLKSANSFTDGKWTIESIDGNICSIASVQKGKIIQNKVNKSALAFPKAINSGIKINPARK